MFLFLLHLLGSGGTHPSPRQITVTRDTNNVHLYLGDIMAAHPMAVHPIILVFLIFRCHEKNVLKTQALNVSQKIKCTPNPIFLVRFSQLPNLALSPNHHDLSSICVLVPIEFEEIKLGGPVV